MGAMKRSTRQVVALALGGALVLAPSSSFANPDAYGYAGKPSEFGPGETCATNCHSPTSPKPVLNITAPSTIAAGATGKVTIVVDGSNSSRTRTALNASMSDGIVVTAGANTARPSASEPEIHAKVPPPSGKTATYDFTFVAPKTSGKITLWVAGMSASGSGSGGDGVTAETRTITVTGGSAPTSDGGTEPPDPEEPVTGEGTGEDGGVSGGSAGSSGGAAGAGSTSSRRVPPAEDEGCHAARVGRPRPATAWLATLGLVGAALVVRHRRRRDGASAADDTTGR